MTTAAQDEKLSDAELAAKLLQWEGADEMLPLPKGLLREAARRLAPRVGDAAPAPFAGYDDGDWPQTLAEKMAINRRSAPPAASADEMELLRRVAEHQAAERSLTFANWNELDVGSRYIAEHRALMEAMIVAQTDIVDLVAGYRKRAAQGVVVSNVDLMAAVFALLEEGRADVAAPLQEAIRLSALPKGQDDNG